MTGNNLKQPGETNVRNSIFLRKKKINKSKRNPIGLTRILGGEGGKKRVSLIKVRVYDTRFADRVRLKLTKLRTEFRNIRVVVFWIPRKRDSVRARHLNTRGVSKYR